MSGAQISTQKPRNLLVSQKHISFLRKISLGEVSYKVKECDLGEAGSVRGEFDAFQPQPIESINIFRCGYSSHTC
jgi:hypothetical protein